MTMLTRQLGQGKSPRAGHMWTARFWQKTPRKRTDAIAMFHRAEETVSGLGVGPGSAPFDSFACGGPIWELWRCKSCKIASLWNLFIERWSFEALQWTRLLLTLLSGQCKTGRGGLPFQASSLFTCHLWSMSHWDHEAVQDSPRLIWLV